MKPGGYAWWYLDALSDDGQRALTLIAFVGSVFSPWYAWSGRRDPLDHCAVNVALYRRSSSLWAMTERGRGDLQRSGSGLRIGRSGLSFDGGGFTADIDEVSCPLPRRLRGRVRLFPEAAPGSDFLLGAEGGHRWWPIAPRARVELAFDEPSERWSGSGYLDCNRGDAPLEQAFRFWTWSRAPLSRGAAVLYDVVPREGAPRALALRFDGAGGVCELAPPPAVQLPRTLFRMPRVTRSEGLASVSRTLTDAHFYARSIVRTRLCGESVTSVHESLSLERFDTRWARLMLPFRMPRRAR